MLDKLLDNHLSPLDQLFLLNKEIYDQLDALEKPIIVVGGQAVSYWLEYYSQLHTITDIDRAQATSVDVDYCGTKGDFLILTDKWKVTFNIAPMEHSTPEIGNSVLKDRYTDKIKETDGLMFVDIGAWVEERGEEPNQVDLLELPMGFKNIDFQCKRLKQHTTHFEFPDEFELVPNDNLLILNPIGCIKSRMLNYKFLKRVKDPTRELERIRLLIPSVALFLQISLMDDGYKQTRKYIDLLMILAKSSLGMDIRYHQGIDLSAILDFLAHAQNERLPKEFINTELPKWRAGIESKFEKKVKQFQEIEKRQISKSLS